MNQNQKYAPQLGESLFHIALLTGITGIIITRLWEHQLQIFPDSITYYSAAQSFLNGYGLATGFGQTLNPLVNFPPLLSLCIAIVNLLSGMDTHAFLVLNSGCLLASTIFIYTISCKAYRSPAIGFFIGCAFLIHPITFEIHRGGLSEPLYLTLVLAMLWHLMKENLMLVGFFAALTILTRYSGFFLLLYIPALVFLPRYEELSIGQVGKMFLIPLMTCIVWMTRNIAVSESLTGRSFIAGAPEAYVLINEIVEVTTAKWMLLPPHLQIIPFALCGLLLPLVAFLQRPASPISLCYLFSLLFVVIARCTLDAEIALNQRTLFLPFILGIVLNLGLILSMAMKVMRMSAILPILALVLSVYGILYAPSYMDLTPFEARYWAQSETISYLKENKDPRVTLYSNGPDFLHFYLGRRNLEYLPARVEAGTRREIPESLETFRKTLAAENYFVFFDDIRWRWYLWEEKDLIEPLGLELKKQFADGRIYQASVPEASFIFE